MHHHSSDLGSLIPKEHTLRSKFMLSYWDNCLCCMTGTRKAILGNHGHPIAEEDWYMTAVEFDFHHHTSEYTCSSLPRMTNHHQLEN